MIFKELARQDIRTTSTVSNQLVDVLEDDVADPAKRKRYSAYYTRSQATNSELPSDPTVKERLFARSADGPELAPSGGLRQVQSGIFQTVHDIDHTEQTANPLLDLTFGIRNTFDVAEDGSITWGVAALNSYFEEFDSQGKAFWSKSSSMVTEKLGIYRQMAAQLLGDFSASFSYPTSESEGATETIDYAGFLSYRRLFYRDGVRRGTFSMRLYRDLVRPLSDTADPDVFSIQPQFPYWKSAYVGGLPTQVSDKMIIITDTEDANGNTSLFGGQVGILRVVSYDSSPVSAGYSPFATHREVGLVFYDSGIVVLNLGRLLNLDQRIGGVCTGIADNGLRDGYNDGLWASVPSSSGLDSADIDVDDIVDTTTNGFLPLNRRIVGIGLFVDEPPTYTLENFFIEGTMDDVVDHIASTRFISDPDSNLTSSTFQNITKIKSMLVQCRITFGDFNYSNNPTYVDENGRIIARSDDGILPFSYITKVGLYSANNDLLAVASLSRPVENGPDRDFSLSLRLDF